MPRNFMFLLVVALTFVGCSPEFNDDECSTTEDCFPDETCVNNRCAIGSSTNNMNNDVATVEVDPTTASIDVGETTTLTATPKNSDGDDVEGATVTWSSNDEAIATVSSTGVVTGIDAGEATITATSGSATGTATITVSLVAVASLTVDPATAEVAIGRTATLTAEPRDAEDNVIAGRTASWSSADETVATVDANGVVTGVAVGTTTITADVDGVTADASIEVVEVAVDAVDLMPAMSTIFVGATLATTVSVTDDQDNVLTGRVVTYESDSLSVATVDTDGVVTGVAPGTATITATSEGVSDDIEVMVVEVPVDSVTLDPTTATIRDNNDTVQLTATVLDANNNTLNRTVTWQSSNDNYATVDANGLVTGVEVPPDNSAVTITATAGGQMATAQITVVPTIATVTVNAPSTTIIVTDGLQFTATLRDSAGDEITDARTVAWSTSDPTIATVSNTGFVTGEAVGTATITATSEGVMGTIMVSVEFGPIDTVIMSPTTASVLVGATQQFSASSEDAVGNVLADTHTWSIAPADNCTIDSTGLASCTVAGAYTVTATSSLNTMMSATAMFTVQSTVTAVNVDQMMPSVEMTTGTVTLTATSVDAAAGTVTDSHTWTIESGSGCTINAMSGEVSACTTAGTYTVTATSVQNPAVSGTVTLAVLGPVASIVITPSPATTTENVSVTFTAESRDSAGNTVADTHTWSIDDTGNCAAGAMTGIIVCQVANTYTVTATSDTDGAITATATLTVNP